ARDTLGYRGPRREHEHRDLVAGRAQAPAHLEPVEAGKTEIEDHRVVRDGRRLLQRADAIRGQCRLMPGVAERTLHRASYGGVVLDQEDVHQPSLRKERSEGDKNRADPLLSYCPFMTSLRRR